MENQIVICLLVPFQFNSRELLHYLKAKIIEATLWKSKVSFDWIDIYVTHVDFVTHLMCRYTLFSKFFFICNTSMDIQNIIKLRLLFIREQLQKDGKYSAEKRKWTDKTGCNKSKILYKFCFKMDRIIRPLAVSSSPNNR